MISDNILCTIAIGPNLPKPLPAFLTNAIHKIEVLQHDEQRTYFQITLIVGENGKIDSHNEVYKYPLLQPLNRLKISVLIHSLPYMLLDGFITHMHYNPASPDKNGTIILTGEDVGILLDQEEKMAEYPAQNDEKIVSQILARYQKYNIYPQIIAPPIRAVPKVNEFTPIQRGTDWDYLIKLADRYNFTFYITSPPNTFTNFAYWGPKTQKGIPTMKPLFYNAGSLTNLTSLNFSYDSLSPTKIINYSLEKKSPEKDTEVIFIETTPKAKNYIATGPLVRKRILKNTEGLNYELLKILAQAKTDASEEKILKITGEVDMSRYATLLYPRTKVSLKGVGSAYDNTYYVERVHHTLQKGLYKQEFTLKAI